MGDWQPWITKLDAASETEADDLVDELSSFLLASPADASSSAAAIKALNVARSPLSIKSAATALAYVASNDGTAEIDCLERCFDASRSDAFLGPAILSVLALLGLRNAAARAGAIRYLLRLKTDDPPPLLVAGVKAIGLLCDRKDDPELRAKLYALAVSEEIAVRAEGRQQVALLRLADALLADSHGGLIASLAAAREAFRVAEGSEEIRPDAKLFHLLLAGVLQFEEIELDREGARDRVKQVALELREMGGRDADQILRMDRSPSGSQIANSCAAVASALEASANEVAKVARWTNFDRSVVRLAESYAEIRRQPVPLVGNEQVIRAISGLADGVFKPRLGPALARKVGRESFEEVIQTYDGGVALAEVANAMRELQRAALEAERTEGFRLGADSAGMLSAMAEKAGCTPEELIRRVNLRIGQNGGDGLAVITELLPTPPGQRGMKMQLPTIGIIVALAEEFDAVRLMLENEKPYRAEGSGGSREYLLGEIPSTRKGIHRVVLAQTMAMGNNSAALRASKLLTDFDGIDAIIMCGIAGGVPNPTSPDNHVRLGDIVVSNRMGVVQYDLGKEKEKTFEHRAPPNPPSARLLEAVQVLERDRLTGKRPWDDHLRAGMAARTMTIPDPSTDVVLDKDKKPIEHPPVSGPIPRVFYSPIASANIVQGNYKKRDKLRDKFKVKAVEMEGSGIADATWEYEKAGYLVVRGVCDYCDDRTKSRQTDAWKPYAAMVAAAYVRALLQTIPGVDAATSSSPASTLSAGARRLLVAAASAKRKTVTMNKNNRTGFHLGTGDKDRTLLETLDDREEAEGRAWVAELVRDGFIEDRWGAGQVFAVTDKGFRAADAVPASG